MMTRIIVALVALLFIAVSPALAQDTGIVSRQSFLYDVWIIVQPIAATLVTVIGPVIVGWLAVKITSLLNISDANARLEMEAKVRAALHAAAENALKYALAKYTGEIGDIVNGSVPAPVMTAAVEYVRSKNPDAAAMLDDKNLEQIILSKAIGVQATMEAGKPQPEVVVAAVAPAQDRASRR